MVDNVDGQRWNTDWPVTTCRTTLGLQGPCYTALFAGCEQLLPYGTVYNVYVLLGTKAPVSLIVRYCSLLLAAVHRTPTFIARTDCR